MLNIPGLPTTQAEWIQLILVNFALVLFILALIIAFFDWVIQKFRSFGANGAEVLFRWVVLLPLGITAIYAFAMHAFFSDLSATTIGWPTSPFQFEVAMANLAFGIIAIFSFNASFGFRLSAVIGNTIWLWGDAIGHIYQMIVNHNFTPGNAGSWLWMDIVIPLILIVCLIRIKRYQDIEEGNE